MPPLPKRIPDSSQSAPQISVKAAQAHVHESYDERHAGNHPGAQDVPLDGVELLVHMAKTGEIDPWNIDIVKVADQYLRAVAELKESDLKITGKTLLYLAILLRMKSDQLAGINYLYPPEDEFLDALMEPDFMDGGKVVQPKFSFRSLDEVIKRRTSTKQPRIRNVTLEDLIRELQKYEEMEKRRSLKEKVEKFSNHRMMDYADFTADDIEEMAHEEFHEDTILHLRDVLGRILLSQEEVSLTDLMQAGRLDKISAYLALLFLAARGGCSMHQEEFYSELYVSFDSGSASGVTPASEDADDESADEQSITIKKNAERAGSKQSAEPSDEDEAFEETLKDMADGHAPQQEELAE